MAEESTYDAIQSLGASIDQFRVQSNANFGRMIGTQVDLINIIKSTEEKAYERSRDQFKQTDMSSAKNPAAGGGAAGVAAGATPKGGGGGMFGKAVGGLAALASVGIGLAGLGALFAGGGYLIKQLSEFDGKKVKENILELLKIPSEVPGGTTVDKAMTVMGTGGALMVIGTGLIAFSAGAGMASAVSYFEKPWAEDVKNNVATLLTILDLPNANFTGVIGLAGTLGAIGLGLLAFNAGAATGVALQGASEAIDKFQEKDDWATQTYNQVKTLLSIMDLENVNFKDVAAFPAVMASIGLGLLAFNAGAASGVAVQGAEAAVKSFTGSNFADATKKQVETLLSILDLPGVTGANVAQFALTMGGIGAGLLAFSVGTATTAVASGAGDAIAKFTEGEADFAKKVYNQVETLLSVTELTKDAGDEETGKVGQFVKTMAGISAGLVLFGAGNLVGTLTEAGGAIVRFLTGADSPIQQIEMIADNAENLEKGASAIDNIRQALSDFSKLKFSGSKIGMEDFAKDLVAATPLIEGAIMGGTIDPKGLGNKVKVMGLANPDVGFEQAAINIRILKEAIAGIGNVNAAAADAGGNGGTVVNNVNNVTNNNGGGADGGPNMNLQVTPMEESKRKSDSLYDYYGLDY